MKVKAGVMAMVIFLVVVSFVSIVNAEWINEFPRDSVDGVVNAVVHGAGQNVYIGGSFCFADKDGNIMRNVAKWDGSAWTALGSGLVGNGVNALAVGPDGALYAGGDFYEADSEFVEGLAKWDGSGWSGLANQFFGNIRALVFGADGDLYAGGDFYMGWETDFNHIARWDGSAWYSLGDGLDDEVDSLAAGPDGALYAGGSFRTAGGGWRRSHCEMGRLLVVPPWKRNG